MYRPSDYTDEQWAAYKEAVAQSDREWALTLAVTLENGVQLQLDENDIVANSLVFKEQSTCSNGIMVGSTFSNSLDFTLLNEDGRFRQYSFINGKVDATVKLYIPELENWAEVKLGTFFIIEAGKKYTTIPVKCMDLMYKFNIPLNKAEPSFPINLSQLYYKVCMLVMGDCPELCDQIPILTLNAFDTTEITCRDFLAYLGCLMGKNFRMSRTNVLEAFWYTDSDCVTTPDTRISITLNDLTVHPTAVSVKDWGGKEYVQKNADTSYLIAFETNPLIQTEEVAVSVLANLTDLLTTVQYRTYDCSFSGDPAVQAGDTVRHQMIMEEQQRQESVPSLIMAHEYRFRGTGKIAAVGEAAEQDRQLSAEVKKIQDVQIQAAKDLNEGLSFAQQTLLNQSKLFGESLALYCGTKLDEEGRLLGFYMASEPIFPEDGIITSDDQVKDTKCYVWVFGANFGVSSTGYKGPYTAGITKDQSIFAKTITADWIRTGVLSALDNTLSIDLQSGRQTLTSKDGWGQTILDGIGAVFTYWNKKVVGAETDGYPKLAYLQITADANQQSNTKAYNAADLKLTWSTYDGKMHTTIGHTIVHAADGSVVEAFYPFEIKSTGPVYISPSLYYEDSILFDNIIMHRTNLVKGNTGVDFLIAPNSIPQSPSAPIPDGQINLMPNPGFEEKTLSPWVAHNGSVWGISINSSRTGMYAALSADSSGADYILYLPSSVVEELGMYDHAVYIGYWFKASYEKEGFVNGPLCLRSGSSPGEIVDTYIEASSDGTAWKYASVIIPPLEQGSVVSLWATGTYGYKIDDIYVYDAQNYLIEQWDDYVARGAN